MRSVTATIAVAALAAAVAYHAVVGPRSAAPSALSEQHIIATLRRDVDASRDRPPRRLLPDEQRQLLLEIVDQRARGEFRAAVTSTRRLLEHAPLDRKARELLAASYEELYDARARNRDTGNFTARLLDTLDALVATGAAERAHPTFPVYTMEGFLSDDECDALVAMHEERYESFAAAPMFCFGRPEFLREAGLGHLLLDGRDGASGARSQCLGYAASAALARTVPWSSSATVHRGEAALADAIEGRLERTFGLPALHAHSLQLLSYEEGVDYQNHTDCLEGHDITETPRAATFLTFLSDVEGGATSFRELGIQVEPKKGRAIVFFSGGPDGRCDPLSTHASEAVRIGKKFIAQKWFSYREDAFKNERPAPPMVEGRAPGQATVYCDFEDGAGISCRWYDIFPLA